MALDQESAELLAEELDNLGVEASVCEGYSGRGMYGKEVIGINLESNDDLMAIGFAAATAGIDWADVPKRVDSLGRGVIVY